jgi:hypothetical protein
MLRGSTRKLELTEAGEIYSSASPETVAPRYRGRGMIRRSINTRGQCFTASSVSNVSA